MAIIRSWIDHICGNSGVIPADSGLAVTGDKVAINS